MSTNIVIPSLSDWTESCISAIYNVQPGISALDNFLEKDALIIVNGKTISRSDLAKELKYEKFLEVAAIVTFNNIVEVPTDKSAPAQAGSVGTFFTVTIEEPTEVRDMPVRHVVTASLNVVIELDPSIYVPPSPIHGLSNRRVKEFNLVVIDTPVLFGSK